MDKAAKILELKEKLEATRENIKQFTMKDDIELRDVDFHLSRTVRGFLDGDTDTDKLLVALVLAEEAIQGVSRHMDNLRREVRDTLDNNRDIIIK